MLTSITLNFFLKFDSIFDMMFRYWRKNIPGRDVMSLFSHCSGTNTRLLPAGVLA